MEIKILAFMQNIWLKDPQIAWDTIKEFGEIRGEEYRRRLIPYALFAGCLSGKVLRHYFGDLCDTIIWEESTKKIGMRPMCAYQPDLDHMKFRINEVKPDLILGFGRTPCNALDIINLEMPIRYEKAHHPASRSPFKVDESFKELLKIIQNESLIEVEA